MLRTIRDNIVEKVASRHIAGPNLDDALRVCRWADQNDYACVLSPWADMGSNGQNGRSRSERMLERFKANIRTLHEQQFDGYLSIKLDALGYDVRLFLDLLAFAEKYDVRVHVDSLGPETTGKTFRILEKSYEYHHLLGCTLPSRFKRSFYDADQAIEMGLAVRIVKGQWQDPEHNVNERDNYVAIADKLAGQVPYIGIATHDLSLARRAVDQLESTHTHFELEQFFSLPLKGRKLAEELKIPYRIYVSYGHPAIPYNYRFALTRPSLAAWMVSDYLFDLNRPWT